MNPLHRLIKSECGRAKLADLQQRRGLPARLRLAWFIVFAAVRDLPLQFSEPSSKA